jgi:SAM-dependent methyltransferase
MTEPTVNQAAFWQGLYEAQGDRWELGGPTPPLVEYLARHPRLPGDLVAVPGCGRGHDARLLARRGYRVRAFDFAEPAIREARALAAAARVEVAFEPRDVFDLAADYGGAFDGLWEYTCFCAIDPARRAEYVALVRALLKPGGWLLACFFPIGERPGGPPFSTTEAEIRRLFEPRFTFEETYVPTTSADGRQGREWLVRARAIA